MKNSNKAPITKEQINKECLSGFKNYLSKNHSCLLVDGKPVSLLNEFEYCQIFLGSIEKTEEFSLLVQKLSNKGKVTIFFNSQCDLWEEVLNGKKNIKVKSKNSTGVLQQLDDGSLKFEIETISFRTDI
jgi:hypothetical protein